LADGIGVLVALFQALGRQEQEGEFVLAMGYHVAVYDLEWIGAERAEDEVVVEDEPVVVPPRHLAGRADRGDDVGDGPVTAAELLMHQFAGAGEVGGRGDEGIYDRVSSAFVTDVEPLDQFGRCRGRHVQSAGGCPMGVRREPPYPFRHVDPDGDREALDRFVLGLAELDEAFQLGDEPGVGGEGFGAVVDVR